MRTFEIRELCADDIFPVCQILADIGLDKVGECLPKDDLRAMMEKIETGKTNEKQKNNADAAALGMAIMFPLATMVITNLSKCRQSLYAFLASVSGLQVEAVGKLPMADFVNLVFAVFKNEGFKDFFTAVSMQFKPITSGSLTVSSSDTIAQTI